jgi:hypothetical protein
MIKKYIWERHKGCKFPKNIVYKDCPEECCYLVAADKIIAFLSPTKPEIREVLWEIWRQGNTHVKPNMRQNEAQIFTLSTILKPSWTSEELDKVLPKKKEMPVSLLHKGSPMKKTKDNRKLRGKE